LKRQSAKLSNREFAPAVPAMILGVADTGPFNYLIQIGHTDILPRIADKIVVPESATALEVTASGLPAPRVDLMSPASANAGGSPFHLPLLR
jgi:hypothetical protein